MAKDKSETSIFKSPSSGDFCTAQQYIAEVMMTRKYDKSGKKLPAQFWNLDKYKKEFVQHIIAANRLTKLYEPEIIIKVLTTTAKHIYSLWWKQLDELIQAELDKKKLESDKFSLEIADTTKISDSTGKKSTLGRLRE